MKDQQDERGVAPMTAPFATVLADRSVLLRRDQAPPLTNALALLAFAVLLGACGREEVTISASKPFVVGSIEMINDGNWRYVRSGWDYRRFNDFFAQKQAIVAPPGIWSVGDTITTKKFGALHRVSAAKGGEAGPSRSEDGTPEHSAAEGGTPQ